MQDVKLEKLKEIDLSLCEEVGRDKCGVVYKLNDKRDVRGRET